MTSESSIVSPIEASTTTLDVVVEGLAAPHVAIVRRAIMQFYAVTNRQPTIIAFSDTAPELAPVDANIKDPAQMRWQRLFAKADASGNPFVRWFRLA